MSEIIKANNTATILEQVILGGDLEKLTPGERVLYHNRVCESLGLNPLTQPFAYIKLNGKLVLYAKKDCTDQLRKINAVSIEPPKVDYIEGMVIVTVTARDKTGRTDSDMGVVAIEGLKGDSRANAIMKSITKAKRRVTLSICGLGMLDETEIETIPDAQPVTTEVAHTEQLAAPPEHWCDIHGCAFEKRTSKDGATWYSHKLPDGSGWCNERPQQPAPAQPRLASPGQNSSSRQDDPRRAEYKAKWAELWNQAMDLGFKPTVTLNPLSASVDEMIVACETLEREIVAFKELSR